MQNLQFSVVLWLHAPHEKMFYHTELSTTSSIWRVKQFFLKE